jgi:hypothetical protein
MKKTLLLGLLILLAGGLFAAEKRLAVFDTSTEGLSEDEISWIPSSVRRRLEADFNDYTAFQLVDVHNQEAIKTVQKNAEKYAYDQATSIELGKLVSAELGVFTTITRAGGRFILSSSVTNLTTGIRLSTVTSDSVAEPVSLFDGAGSAVNRVFVKLCDDLGIKLSAVDMYVLLKGSSEDDDTQLKMTQEEISKYEQKQKEQFIGNTCVKQDVKRPFLHCFFNKLCHCPRKRQIDQNGSKPHRDQKRRLHFFIDAKPYQKSSDQPHDHHLPCQVSDIAEQAE